MMVNNTQYLKTRGGAEYPGYVEFNNNNDGLTLTLSARTSIYLLGNGILG